MSNLSMEDIEIKEIKCVVCGVAAAFPAAVKEPYTCITCQSEPNERSGQLRCWQITCIRPDRDDKKQIRTYEMVTARNIEQVWQWLAPERADERTEIESIQSVGPIVAALDKSDYEALAGKASEAEQRAEQCSLNSRWHRRKFLSEPDLALQSLLWPRLMSSCTPSWCATRNSSSAEISLGKLT